MLTSEHEWTIDDAEKVNCVFEDSIIL